MRVQIMVSTSGALLACSFPCLVLIVAGTTIFASVRGRRSIIHVCAFGTIGTAADGFRCGNLAVAACLTIARSISRVQIMISACLTRFASSA